MMNSSKHLQEIVATTVALSSEVGIWKVCAQEDERSDREERIAVALEF